MKDNDQLCRKYSGTETWSIMQEILRYWNLKVFISINHYYIFATRAIRELSYIQHSALENSKLQPKSKDCNTSKYCFS